MLLLMKHIHYGSLEYENEEAKATLYHKRQSLFHKRNREDFKEIYHIRVVIGRKNGPSKFPSPRI